ncbi:ImmA/IrrE family metallo-endopeptidase [Fimbriiglobus ruber]|uniref:ImmA/IrrE family metallo-endopeptidase n=1 Tax=Fimbriiglobus ruber TaxID=1908690 RepID=UPI00137A8C63|nr:ImmA/IrrE family metallo-endopeptidase [Fimbriiglobus ruber]
MSDSIALFEAESEAENVIKQQGFTALPICPFTIARNSDIVVQPKDSSEPGVSGFLVRVGNVFGIQYARHIDNEGFIRFTVAHELGHYFLPGHAQSLFPNGDGVHRSHSGFISHNRHERQADQFASALLMPGKLFSKAVDSAGQGFGAIQSLALLCKTSITATAIRLAKYTDDPVAVIVTSGSRVEYCFLSEKLKDVSGLQWLKKGDVIAPKSATAKFNLNSANINEAKQDEGSSWLDEWFDGAPQIEMNEDVIGLGSYGKTLTVLFTDEAIDDEEDEYDD